MTYIYGFFGGGICMGKDFTMAVGGVVARVCMGILGSVLFNMTHLKPIRTVYITKLFF